MKIKTLLSAAILAGLATSALAQGTITFSPPGTSYITNILTSARVAAGSTFRVALYYLPDQATAPTTADFDERGIMLGAAANIQPVPGQFSGGSRVTPLTTPAGDNAWFQVRAWETAFGATYEEAKNNPTAIGGRLALIGTSNVIQLSTGNPNAVPVKPAPNLVGMQSFLVAPVPEPSVIALGLLGLGALMMLRRKK
jgi:hypothetical protein